MQCARHPNIETDLACGRCETAICPRCVVTTDVGARCPTCAPTRKLPQFEISPIWLLRGAGAALLAGVALGTVWRILLAETRGLGLFSLLIAFAIGYAVAEAVSLATNRKAGPPLQIAAACGVAVAYVTRNLLFDIPIMPSGDTWGYVVVIVGMIVASNRLRI